MKKFSVYVLLKNSKPVYVGCSNNVNTRLKAHKKNKTFHSFTIIEVFDKKKDALIAERSIIKFMSLFNQNELYNGLYASFPYKTIPYL